MPSSLPLAQPAPWGPKDVLFAPGVQAFAQTVSDGLAGVGDKADTFDADLSTTATVLGSFPNGLAGLDQDLASAVAAHEDLRSYDPGVPALMKQALDQVGKSEQAFEGSLVMPSTPSPPPPPPSSGGGTGGGTSGGATAGGGSTGASSGGGTKPTGGGGGKPPSGPGPTQHPGVGL